MRYPFKIIAVAFSTLSVTLQSCDDSDDRAAADLTMPVVVEKVKLANIAEYITTTGTLRARKEEAVVAEVEGILTIARTNGTLIQPGVYVEVGHLLAEIDNPSYLLEVRVESQRMAMENAVRELDKQKALFDEGGVTEKELELARKAALDARLNFEGAELQADKVRLKAPISGYLANLRSTFDGVRVRAGFEFCRVMDYSTVVVEARLPNSDLGRVRIGQKVMVENYAIPDQRFEARLTALDPTIDPQTRTFAVIMEVPNDNLILRPGMFVKTDIVVLERQDAVVIPKEALQVRDGRPIAFVVKGLSAEQREVEQGIESKEEIEILQGLSEGDRLVVKGQETLRDKSKVSITE
jgi:RND family efflux transporter MFP subunit